jgi:hypothetical protein
MDEQMRRELSDLADELDRQVIAIRALIARDAVVAPWEAPPEVEMGSPEVEPPPAGKLPEVVTDVDGLVEPLVRKPGESEDEWGSRKAKWQARRREQRLNAVDARRRAEAS